MDRASFNKRLSEISTQWTTIFQAHTEPHDAARAALERLVQRYRGAVYRYLLGALRDPDAAEELFQEFALRLVRGDFRRADPQRGRFRDYLKTALIHLITDYHRAHRNQPLPLPPDCPAPPAPEAVHSMPEHDWLVSWREELLECTWRALEKANPTYHAVLLLRVENPEMSSAEMARKLAAQLQKPIAAPSVRKTLQRAHQKFGELLVAEVAHSLEKGDQTVLRTELLDLDLMRYCRSVLEKHDPRKRDIVDSLTEAHPADRPRGPGSSDVKPPPA
jgi:RNA polymerase sigma factor (sigma-70 family)